MNVRARLSLFALEARENPSVPTVPPVGGEAPPPSTVTVAEAAVTAGATVTTTTDTNTVYNTPPVTLP